jgi:enolase
MPTIKTLKARQVLDSRGTPTVEVDCVLSDSSFGTAAVPSGASTGTYEALELRDGDKSKYDGKSVEKAVANVNGPLTRALRGKSVADQRAIDRVMIDLDGTSNKSSLGANAILAVSMSVAHARATSEGLSLWLSLARQFGVKLGTKVKLPVPLMNVLNGGVHADSGLSFQEFMIVPTCFHSFKEALRAGVEVFYALKRVLKQFQYVTSVGDEGGFAPQVADSDHACSILMRAIEAAGYKGRVQLALDCAASEFSQKGKYVVDGKVMSSSKLLDYYGTLIEHYPIVSIEDSHSENDWEGFRLMRERYGSRVQIVGDDLFVTNTKRIQQGIEKKAATAVLIKLNQIGTVSETVDAVRMCQKAGWNAIISHRSGETSDTFIADLAVGLQSGQIKTGSLSRTERLCKYNQLLRIEEELGKSAIYVSPFGR